MFESSANFITAETMVDSPYIRQTTLSRKLLLEVERGFGYYESSTWWMSVFASFHWSLSGNSKDLIVVLIVILVVV